MLHSVKLLHTSCPRYNYRIALVIILHINFQLFIVIPLQMKVFFWVFAPCSILGFCPVIWRNVLPPPSGWLDFTGVNNEVTQRQKMYWLYMKVWGRNKHSTLHGLCTWMVTIVWIIILVCGLLLLVSKTPIFIHDLQPYEYLCTTRYCNSILKFLPHL